MVQLNQDFINSIAKDIPSNLCIEDFIHYCGLPLRPSIRINTLKISSADFVALMRPKGWLFESIPWCTDGFWVTHNTPVQMGNTIEHLQGLFYIQEASSMLPPLALQAEISDAEIILDMASAPGSKTTQMAAMMNNQGIVVANEYSASRVKVLHANIARMGAKNCAITHFDARVFGQYLFEVFDTVLLDAPCSGEGTVRKDPDSLKHWDINEITGIANTQKDLIESAFMALKPGGHLVYSTCTLNQVENQEVCHHLKHVFNEAVEFISLENLFDNAELACTPDGFLHVWPQIYDSEGFFVAKIKKCHSVARSKEQPKKQKNFPFQTANKKQIGLITDYFAEQFGIVLPSNSQIHVRDNEYWLFPEQMDKLIGLMRYQRIGLKLADSAKHGFKVRHEAITALGGDNMNHLSLSTEQSIEYLMGRDIHLDTSEKAKGELIVCYQGQVLGVAKHLGHRIKNNLPRDLVKDKVISSKQS